MNQTTDNFQFKHSALKIKKEALVKHWGEKDGNLFVSKCLKAIQFLVQVHTDLHLC